ncbi:MAG: hypothetical protein RIQ28_1027, partial [Pseudomonadota bacterium]
HPTALVPCTGNFFAKRRATLWVCQTSMSPEGQLLKHCPYASATAYSIVGTVVWINGGPAQGNPAATLPLRQTYFALRYLLLKTGFRFSTKAVIASPKSLI